MRTLKTLYFLFTIFIAWRYSEKNDATRTMFCCAHMIIAAIYIVSA